jgi:serine/threonine protein kinase/dienelactone hydrolase
MIGKTVSHYKILEKIGGGGMGVVYKAEDTKLKRVVALKFLPPELTRDEETKRRFIHEAQATSVLQHTNICTIHDIDQTDDGQMFICMDYYEGETLKLKIEKGILKIEEAIEYTIQIAQGLQKAHEKGIIHRDIKPANIIITNDSVVKIVDFGIAKLSSRTMLTKEGTTLGTVSYMSPEQTRGDSVDHRTDIWSLGVIFYEMLTGQLPFKGEYDQAVMYSIINEEPEPPKNLKKDITVELEKIIIRALAKDKNSRYNSANEMLKDLTEYQSSFITTESQKINFNQIIRHIIKPKIVVPGVLLFIILTSTLFWFIKKDTNIQWAKEKAVHDIIELIDNGNYIGAFQIAQKAEKYIPTDSMLTQLWPKMSQVISIQTTPPGADVYIKEYTAIEKQWDYLGRTPIDSARIPKVYFRWKIEKDGYETIERASFGRSELNQLMLIKRDSLPPDMIRVPGGEHSILILGRSYEDVILGDYLIDKYEVTNKQFKYFIKSGGYQRPEFWKYKFIKDEKILSWKKAMAEFCDATGRLGPSTWELGNYLEGQENYPVCGVSWYEAAAYAEFAGKRLPTIFHWKVTAGTYYSQYIIPFSNFGKKGIAPIGRYAGLSGYGSYDMAGNIREWCYNSTAENKYILGGSWNDQSYMFYLPDAKSPFDRSPGNGFRCIKYISHESTSKEAERPVQRYLRDYSKEKPVSDEIFKIYAGLYSYDKTELNPKIEFIEDNSKYWRKEKIFFNTAYGNERMSAYLFLPKNVQPPYQTLVFFPGAGAMTMSSSENGDNLFNFSFVKFIIKSGRALLYPVYKSTHERYDNYEYWKANLYDYRDHVIFWSKDLGRSIDYLETRSDIELEKLGFIGFSWGSQIAPILLGIESRIKVAVLLHGGFWLLEGPAEVDQINFAPRVKIPVLMLNGRFDYLFPYEISQIPMYHYFGTSEEHKRQVVFEVGHGVVNPKNKFVKEMLDWLDRYLGPVK